MWHWFIALILISTPLSMHAEEINAGFVRGIWYSSERVFADTPTRVYVAIRNNTGADLTGTVTFFANDKKLGTQPVAALNNRIIESWVDWEPAYGEHTLRAELSRVKLSAVGSETETVATALAAATDTLFVDYDTDSDDVGNATDDDDDGDGASDTTEATNGTHPLVASNTKTEAAPRATEQVDVATVPVRSASDNTTVGGLERYLTPSRADTLLGSITSWADTTKAKLDTYRDERARERAAEEQAPQITVDNNGFGEVTRSTDPDAAPEAPSNPPNSLVSDLVALIGTLLGGIMTLILSGISLLLGHALVLQLLLLLAILAGTYITARKLSHRPIAKKRK